MPIRTQVSLFRSLAISLVGRDEEGVYRPEFVERAFAAARETPTQTFTSPTDFLRQIESVGG